VRLGDALHLGTKLLLDSGEFEKVMDRCMGHGRVVSFL